MNAHVAYHTTMSNVDRSQKITSRKAVFLIPVAAMFLALFNSRHDLGHAMQAGGEVLLGHDLVYENDVNAFTKQLSYVILGLTGVFLLRKSSPMKIRRPAISLGILSVVLFAFASCLWSSNPADSVKGVAVPLLILIFGMGVARHWTFKDLCQAVVAISMATLVTGVIAEIAVGTFFSGADYRFSGMLHPNRQALSCGLMCLASVTLWQMTKVKSWLLLVAIGVGFLFLTGSRGGLLSIMVAVFAVWTLSSSRGFLLFTFQGLLGLVSLVVLWCAFDVQAQHFLSNIFSMGRETGDASTSFMARIPIWQQVYADAQQQFLIGHGVDGFWTSDRIHGYSTIHDNWSFSNAHSIYLETFADLGIIGVLLIGSVTLTCLFTGLRLHGQSPEAGYFFVIACILLSAVNGMVEAIAIRPGYLFLVTVTGICMLTTVHIGKHSNNNFERLGVSA